MAWFFFDMHQKVQQKFWKIVHWDEWEFNRFFFSKKKTEIFTFFKGHSSVKFTPYLSQSNLTTYCSRCNMTYSLQWPKKNISVFIHSTAIYRFSLRQGHWEIFFQSPPAAASQITENSWLYYNQQWIMQTVTISGIIHTYMYVIIAGSYKTCKHLKIKFSPIAPKLIFSWVKSIDDPHIGYEITKARIFG